MDSANQDHSNTAPCLISRNINVEEHAPIGKGAYGKVFRGQQNKNVVAIKRMVYCPKATNGIPLSSLREMAAGLHMNKDSPTLICLRDWALHDSSITESSVYLVYEMMRCDLSTFLRLQPVHPRNKLRRHIAPRLVQRFANQILCGLDEMHINRLVHRDMKPDNLLIDKNLNLKIADFGLTHVQGFEGSRTPEVVTLWYRAPEILLRTGYSSACDMWSAGLIIAEIYLNRPLIVGENELAVVKNILKLVGQDNSVPCPRPLAQWQSFVRPHDLPLVNKLKNFISPDDDKELYSLISRLLQFNPSRRPIADEALDRPFFYNVYSNSPLPNMVDASPMPHSDSCSEDTDIENCSDTSATESCEPDLEQQNDSIEDPMDASYAPASAAFSQDPSIEHSYARSSAFESNSAGDSIVLSDDTSCSGTTSDTEKFKHGIIRCGQEIMSRVKAGKEAAEEFEKRKCLNANGEDYDDKEYNEGGALQYRNAFVSNRMDAAAYHLKKTRHSLGAYASVPEQDDLDAHCSFPPTNIQKYFKDVQKELRKSMDDSNIWGMRPSLPIAPALSVHDDELQSDIPPEAANAFKSAVTVTGDSYVTVQRPSLSHRARARPSRRLSTPDALMCQLAQSSDGALICIPEDAASSPPLLIPGPKAPQADVSNLLELGSEVEVVTDSERFDPFSDAQHDTRDLCACFGEREVGQKEHELFFLPNASSPLPNDLGSRCAEEVIDSEYRLTPCERSSLTSRRATLSGVPLFRKRCQAVRPDRPFKSRRSTPLMDDGHSAQQIVASQIPAECDVAESASAPLTTIADVTDVERGVAAAPSEPSPANTSFGETNLLNALSTISINPSVEVAAKMQEKCTCTNMVNGVQVHRGGRLLMLNPGDQEKMKNMTVEEKECFENERTAGYYGCY